MHGWCSTIPCPMLVQCSSNAHLMLVQYSFVVLLQCSLEAHRYCSSGLCIPLRWFCKLLWRSFNSHSMQLMLVQWPPKWALDFNARQMLIRCSSNAPPLLFGLFCYNANWRLFETIWIVFEYILVTSLTILQFSLNALWINWCSSMLVQFSYNAHLMLIQYSLDYSVTRLIAGSLRLFRWSLYTFQVI